MNNILLSKREEKRTSNFLVARLNDKGELLEFVVCSHYNNDGNNPNWDWGHYFDKLADAMEYLRKD